MSGGILTLAYTSGAVESIEVSEIIADEVAPEVIEAEGWIATAGPGIEESFIDRTDVVGLIRFWG